MLKVLKVGLVVLVIAVSVALLTVLALHYAKEYRDDLAKGKCRRRDETPSERLNGAL